MEPLRALRARIDALDDRILDLLNERAGVVEEVYACKRKAAGSSEAPAFAPKREAEIFLRLAARNAGPFPAEGVRAVFREVISACISLEGSFKVACAGRAGSPAHRAALDCFGRSVTLLPVPSSASVHRLLRDGSAAYGVVPASALKRFKAGPFAPCARWKDPFDRRTEPFVVVGPPLPPAS